MREVVYLPRQEVKTLLDGDISRWEGYQVWARGMSGDIVRLQPPRNEEGEAIVCDDAWGEGVTPEEGHRWSIETVGFACSTAGAWGRECWRLVTHAAGWPPNSPEHRTAMMGWVRGGIQRCWGTYAPQAVEVDLRAAYAAALLGGLPVVRPTWVEGVELARMVERRDPGMGVMCAAPLKAGGPCRLLATETEGGELTWPGRVDGRVSLPELAQLLEAGYQLTGRGGAWVARMSHAHIPTLERWRDRLPKKGWKTLYTRIWPASAPTGGWTGVVCSDPWGELSRLPEGKRALARVRGAEKILWMRDSGDGKWAVSHPLVSGWVTSHTRAACVELARQARGVVQIYVDSVTAEEFAPAVLAESERWRETGRGEWLASGPGRYCLGEKLRHSGTGDITPEELRAEAHSALTWGGYWDPEQPDTPGWEITGMTATGHPVAWWRE